jgi:hypothetical protein
VPPSLKIALLPSEATVAGLKLLFSTPEKLDIALLSLKNSLQLIAVDVAYAATFREKGIRRSVCTAPLAPFVLKYLAEPIQTVLFPSVLSPDLRRQILAGISLIDRMEHRPMLTLMRDWLVRKAKCIVKQARGET